MATFFSGTDNNALIQEGNSMNNFVSLIVNNVGTYTAAITKKVVAHKKEHITTESTESYQFFNKGTVEERNNTSEKTEEYDETFIEKIKLIVIRPQITFQDSTISRFNEVGSKKTQAVSKIWTASQNTFKNDYPNLFKASELNSLQEEETDDLPEFEEDLSSYEDLESIVNSISWDTNTLNLWIKQLLVGTPFVNNEVINVSKLIEAVITSYERRYPSKQEESLETFKDFETTWIDWFIYNLDADFIEKEPILQNCDMDMLAAIVAYKLNSMISTGRNNVYIRIICDLLNKYTSYYE